MVGRELGEILTIVLAYRPIEIKCVWFCNALVLWTPRITRCKTDIERTYCERTILSNNEHAMSPYRSRAVTTNNGVVVQGVRRV